MSAQIGVSTKILSGCFIGDNVEIGKNNIIGPNVVIGTPPQHRDYYTAKRKLGKIKIGDRNIIREFATIHAPMEGYTIIGNDCFIMSYAHVSHDTVIGDNVVLTNNVQIAGHSQIMESVIIGLSTAVHQYTTIGSYSMVGMGSIVTKDIPPFLVYRNFKCYKVNVIGLERNGFSTDEIQQIVDIYKGVSFVDCSSSRQIRDILNEYDILRNHERNVVEVSLE